MSETVAGDALTYWEHIPVQEQRRTASGYPFRDIAHRLVERSTVVVPGAGNETEVVIGLSYAGEDPRINRVVQKMPAVDRKFEPRINTM